MQRVCPKCGWKVFGFNVQKIQFCPSCGVRFTSEIKVPIGWPSMIFLVCPGIVTLLIAMPSGSNHALRLGIGCGVAIALVFSILIGLRSKGRTERIWAIFIAFMAGVLSDSYDKLEKWASASNPFFTQLSPTQISPDLLSLIPFAALVAILYLTGRGTIMGGGKKTR